MALNENGNNQNIEDLENYYSKQPTSGRVKAWSMAFLSLLVTTVVIGSLFFGGRLLYRTFSDAVEPETTSDDTGSKPSTQADSNSNSDPNTSDGTVQGSNNEGGVVDDQAASTSEPNATDSSTATNSDSDERADSEVLAANGESGDLPDTGAGSTLFILAVGVFAVGYVVALRHFAQA